MHAFMPPFQISQADIENFKKEYETRQKDLPTNKQIESR